MSFSISCLTLNSNSRTDLNADLLRPASLNHRSVCSNLRNLHHETHLRATSSDQCFEQMRQISEKIGSYLVHFYADARMFVRSFISMFGSTTREDIERRINEVRQFKRVILNPDVRVTRALLKFERLSEETKNLFFYTTSSCLIELGSESSQVIREEILRECDKVISFQNVLTAVHTFFCVFSQRSSGSSVGITDGGFWGWFRRRGETMVEGAGRSERTLPPVDLNIPNTLAYRRNAIPEEVAQKGVEIARLGALFIGTIPARFKDPATLEFMAIPVFDASHTAVQNGLPALRRALADGGTIEDQLNARHHMDKESMDHHIGVGGIPRYWETRAAAVCPSCRHPVREDSLRIDTGLQDEILAFLRP